MDTLDLEMVVTVMKLFIIPNERKLNSQVTSMVNSCREMLLEFILTKLFNSSSCSDIGCDTSS